MIYPSEITPITLVDYPGKTAAVFWYGGCNLRCPYCYNTELVLNGGGPRKEDAFEIIDKHKHLLDGVVLSGGEATLNPYLPDTARRIKEMGLCVKLDTNGTNPGMVAAMLSEGILDYVALDCKYGKDNCLNFGIPDLWDKFAATLCLLKNNFIPFEVRTTVHPLLMSESLVMDMLHDVHNLGYEGTHYIQPFFNPGKTLANLRCPESYEDIDWDAVVSQAADQGIKVEIRKP